MKPKLRSFLLASNALLAITYSHAATLTWDANGNTAAQTDGAGAWDTAAELKWWNGSTNVDWTSTDNAIFGNGGAGGAVTLASPTTVGSLSFNYFTGTYTLGTAAQTITLNNGITRNAGAGTVAFASNVLLGAAQTWANNSTTQYSVKGGINLNGFALTVGGVGNTDLGDSTANIITGAGGIIKNGTGNLTLSGGGTAPVHNFSGGITVNGGRVAFQLNTNVTAVGNITLNGGYLGGRSNSSPTFAGGLGTGATAIQITGGVSGFSGEGGTSSTFTIGTALSTLQWGNTNFNPTVLILGGLDGMNANAKGSLNNAIDLNGTTRTITSLHTNGDGATSTGFTISGGIVNTAGSAAGLIKTGAGAIILGAANTYNGSTSIQGGSIILSAAAAAINSTTSLGLSGGGTLRLVNTAQVNRFADGAAITVSSGGTISYENTNTAAITYTETLGAATVSGGLLNVVQSTNQATSNGQTLTFGGLSQSGTGSVAFSAGGTGPQATGLKNMIVVTGGSTTAANEIIGPWATTGTTAALQTDYAVFNADFVVPAAIASSAESTWSTTHAATSNYTLVHGAGSALDGRLTATRNINSLRANSATNAIASVDFATNDTITVTGSTFANGDVVTFGGTAPGGLATGQPYYVVGASGDTFSVASTSGGTKIDLTSAGTSNLTAGITLSTGNNLGAFGILNAQGSALVIGRSGTGVVTLPTTSAGNLYVTVGGGSATSIGVPIADNTGALTLVKNGASTLRLYSANTYTGDTIINSGTLQIGVNGLVNGANLGSGNYAGNIFIGAGASLDFQTNSNQTLSGVISGDGALLKRYIGTLTLTGNNTYTGKTTIGAITNAGDPTLVVSSFNSVSNPVASSSLGRPTTVANGTIEMGSNNSSPNPTIRYNGNGEITDRVINFTFNSGATRTLDASNASGLLKFTSAFTSNGTTTGSIVLKGTGSGEISQGLPFGFTNLTKSDAGTWTLGGSIGNTGTTTLSAGTLIINGNQPSGGAFAVNGTSTLGGSGTVSGAVTVAAGANLAPGTSVGTLTMKSTLNISASAGGTGKLNYELGPIAASDKIVVGGTLTIGAGTLNFADFNFTALGGLENGTYKLITSGAPVSGLLDSTPGTLTGTVGTGSGTLQISGGGTGNDIELVVSGVGGGPGPVDHFDITAIGSPQTVGTAITGITLTAKDSLNNTATGFTGTVTFGGTGGFTGTSASFVLGVLSGVSVTPTVAGSNLTFTVDDDSGPSVGTTTITTIQTQYQAWAGGALFDQDANNDGVDNGLAFLLGASGPTAAIPAQTFSESGGNLTMTFSALNDASRGSAILNVQHSSDLGIGDPWASAPVTNAGTAAVGVTFAVTPGSPNNTVTATISNTQATAGKLFGRLKATE